MLQPAEKFVQELVKCGVIDSGQVHHEFNQGLHGRKVDFDKIETASDLFRRWVNLTASSIRDKYTELPDALLGVANGTNRLAEAVAKELGGEMYALITEKVEQSKPVLNKESSQLVKEKLPKFVLVVEDVGTKGTNSLSAAKSAAQAGVPRVEVLNTWQRNETLELLDEARITYKSVIKKVMPNYTPEDCRTIGYCAQGLKIIPYGSD